MAGRIIGGPAGRTDREAYERILRSNARVLFSPGDMEVSSELVTILPGYVGIVRAYDFSLDDGYVSVYGVSVNHVDYTHQIPERSTDLNDFSHSNGIAEMNLGGNAWRLTTNDPVLVVALPGSYRFAVSDASLLDTLRVEIDVLPSKDMVPLPGAYMAGVTNGQ